MPSAVNRIAQPLTKPRKKKTTAKTNQVKSESLKWALAVLAGCSTPALVLAMSTLAASVASSNTPLLALLPTSVMVLMLIVSTPHIAEAKQSVGWVWWQSWAFAVGVDVAITVSEFLSVWTDAPHWLTLSVVVCGVCYSAFLNTVVNLRHARLVG